MLSYDGCKKSKTSKCHSKSYEIRFGVGVTSQTRSLCNGPVALHCCTQFNLFNIIFSEKLREIPD